MCDSGDSFDAIHTATAIHRLATHGKWGSTRGEPPDELLRDPRFAQLMSLVEANLARMNSQGLANVAWACARLNHDPGEDVLAAIAGGIERELAAASSVGGVGGGNGGARGGKHSHGGHSSRGGVRPQAVSNTLWAFGQLKYKPDVVVLASVTHHAQPLLRNFRAQELANTLLGLVELEHDPGADFMQATYASARDNLRQFEGQETSNLLWCCARLNRPPPLELTTSLLEQCAAQNLGGMASALNLSQARSVISHRSPYDRVGVVNAIP